MHTYTESPRATESRWLGERIADSRTFTGHSVTMVPGETITVPRLGWRARHRNGVRRHNLAHLYAMLGPSGMSGVRL